ncbi:response regulator [Butyrivibrio sp. CB08]|uniref:response regulator n=1 Tax=Butyrivibrio sp. CB08 TaxID=2364879 RepID=UPI000EAA40F3|nr:response regulator [Butyrivibrio sp. CB08]RKM61373.1 response regulator [Butyrivibrio sp. CB08]
MKKLKILVTGKNRRIATDVCNHLAEDKDYHVIKCSAKQDVLFATVPQERPRVIIICLGDETKETIKTFDILKECAKLGAITLIVVANSEDKSLFIKYTGLEKMFFLSRPVSLYMLYDKLEEVEKKYLDGEDDDALLSEYVNPDPDKVQRKHILAVDDSAQQLMQIKEHLKEFYDVTLVGSGKDAFKLLSKRKVDLILLDYMMPDMDGPEVFRKLKDDPMYAYIPVIFLTGVTEKDLVIKTLVDLKPQGYVVKPSKKSELVAKIIDVLG